MNHITNLQQPIRVCSAFPRPRVPEAYQAELEKLVASRQKLDEVQVLAASLVVVVRYTLRSTARIAIGVGSGPCPVVASRLTDMVPC